MAQRVHDFHDGNLHFQERFGTRRLADRLAERASERLTAEQRGFIERADMFFMATCDHRGLPTCSYKGGDPGFVTVVDDGTIAFPNYDGNGKYQSMGNLLKNANVGLLFIDFVKQARLRAQGVVEIDEVEDDALMGKYPGAQFIVRVRLTEVYSNCARYVHRYELVERSQYVPRQGAVVPTPEWKRELREYLPSRGEASGGGGST